MTEGWREFNEFFTVQEVAGSLHLASSTIRTWIRQGRLPAYRFGRNCTRILSTDIDAFLSAARIGKGE